MDFASAHVFQPRCEEEACEEVDEEELASSWSKSSPVYLDVAPPPALPPPPPPCSRLRRVEAADADSSEDVDGLGTELGPELGGMMAATTVAAPAAKNVFAASIASADASAALTSLQEADYCGFSSLSESSKHAASIAAGDDEEEEEEGGAAATAAADSYSVKREAEDGQALSESNSKRVKSEA
eukprot:m.268377 g.268377  ORF g.268377 m.268377 type:complete len:184 (+) comp26806_c1_seq5:144-695(+)